LIVSEEKRLGRTKYARTPHLSWSQSNSSDDNWLTDTKHFEGKRVIITSKLDGECTTMYSDYIHARSIDSGSHPCRTRIRATWGQIRHEIPIGWRIAGENMEAAHSIWYLDLDDAPHPLFYCFGIYDETQMCLSWDDMLEYCAMLGLLTPPVFYDGVWDEKLVRNLWDARQGRDHFTTVQVPEDHRVPSKPWIHDGLPMPPTTGEGYVVRVADSFHHDDFAMSCAKWVRHGHVQTTNFWLNLPVLPNLTRTSFSSLEG
jgi:hypothetical protein